jgi:transposase
MRNCPFEVTQLKNSIHKDLDSSHIKLSSAISDIFGKSGMHIIRGLLDGQDLDAVLKRDNFRTS